MAGSRAIGGLPYSGLDAATPLQRLKAAVVGGGPAGLMAAETLAEGGAQVHLFDRMPSVGRKLLLAGRGGLNLSHAEVHENFVARYGPRSAQVGALLQEFMPQALRDWAAEMGVQTFVGSSGRIFPCDLKAAPLLRAWLQRLRRQGVVFHMRHRWLGWRADALRFDSPGGERLVDADATVLALGGGSWARLGSDGSWYPTLGALGVELAPLRPSNCGFEVEGRPGHGGLAGGWSDHFRSRCAGQALKSVALEIRRGEVPAWRQLGEMVISDYGVEGSLVYAASSRLRDAIDAHGHADFSIDLLPLRDLAWLEHELAHPRGARSLSTHLKTRLGLFGAKAALLHERVATVHSLAPAQLAALIKAVPMRATAARPLDEAISSAGGVRFEALDANAMLSMRAGVFCAGEMLDWEAPTGGYLLNACFASGRVAGRGALRWMQGAAPSTKRTTASRGTAIP
jgi:uncharacterized flavoprotein (TIGR03862 family)